MATRNAAPRGAPDLRHIRWADPNPPPGYVPGVGRGAKPFVTNTDLGGFQGTDDRRKQRTVEAKAAETAADRAAEDALDAFDDVEAAIAAARKKRDPKRPRDDAPAETDNTGMSEEQRRLLRVLRAETTGAPLAEVDKSQWSALETTAGLRMVGGASKGSAAGGAQTMQRTVPTASATALRRQGLLETALSAETAKAATTTDGQSVAELLAPPPALVVDSETRAGLKDRIREAPDEAKHYVTYGRVLRAEGKLQSALRCVLTACRRDAMAHDAALWREALAHCPDDKTRRAVAKEATEKAGTPSPELLATANAAPGGGLPAVLCDVEALWVVRAGLEPLQRQLLLRSAVEALPQSGQLWDLLLEDEAPADRKEILRVALQTVPAAAPLWLRLAAMETPANAKRVFARAMKEDAIRRDPAVWVAAAAAAAQVAFAEPQGQTPWAAAQQAASDVLGKGIAAIHGAVTEDVEASWVGAAARQLAGTDAEVCAGVLFRNAAPGDATVGRVAVAAGVLHALFFSDAAVDPCAAAAKCIDRTAASSSAAVDAAVERVVQEEDRLCATAKPAQAGPDEDAAAGPAAAEVDEVTPRQLLAQLLAWFPCGTRPTLRPPTLAAMPTDAVDPDATAPPKPSLPRLLRAVGGATAAANLALRLVTAALCLPAGVAAWAQETDVATKQTATTPAALSSLLLQLLDDAVAVQTPGSAPLLPVVAHWALKACVGPAAAICDVHPLALDIAAWAAASGNLSLVVEDSALAPFAAASPELLVLQAVGHEAEAEQTPLVHAAADLALGALRTAKSQAPPQRMAHPLEAIEAALIALATTRPLLVEEAAELAPLSQALVAVSHITQAMGPAASPTQTRGRGQRLWQVWQQAAKQGRDPKRLTADALGLWDRRGGQCTSELNPAVPLAIAFVERHVLSAPQRATATLREACGALVARTQRRTTPQERYGVYAAVATLKAVLCDCPASRIPGAAEAAERAVRELQPLWSAVVKDVPPGGAAPTLAPDHTALVAMAVDAAPTVNRPRRARDAIDAEAVGGASAAVRRAVARVYLTGKHPEHCRKQLHAALAAAPTDPATWAALARLADLVGATEAQRAAARPSAEAVLRDGAAPPHPLWDSTVTFDPAVVPLASVLRDTAAARIAVASGAIAWAVSQHGALFAAPARTVGPVAQFMPRVPTVFSEHLALAQAAPGLVQAASAATVAPPALVALLLGVMELTV